MPAPSDEPLSKTTLNLYTDDIAYLRRVYGHGWSTEVRNRIRDFCKDRQRIGRGVGPAIEEDLSDE